MVATARSQKVGTGFRKRSCANNKLNRDGDSKKSHHALDLGAMHLLAAGAELEGLGDGEEGARIVRLVERDAVVERNRALDAELQVVGQIKAHPGAGERERQRRPVAVEIPRIGAIDIGVELIALEKIRLQHLVEAQLDRPAHAVVAADLGAPEAAAERSAEIEFLRREQRRRGELAGERELQ